MARNITFAAWLVLRPSLNSSAGLDNALADFQLQSVEGQVIFCHTQSKSSIPGARMAGSVQAVYSALPSSLNMPFKRSFTGIWPRYVLLTAEWGENDRFRINDVVLGISKRMQAKIFPNGSRYIFYSYCILHV